MDKKALFRNLAVIIIFLIVGLTEFTKNVRIVQVLGLFTCGAVVGSSFVMIVKSFKPKTKAE
jgi:predicted metal-binding protein